MAKNIYDELSEERKSLQKQGLLPEWFTTAGWQLFKSKYLYGTGEAFRGQAMRIAETAANHMAKEGSRSWHEWADKFFTLIWNGWLSCSTPVLANMGTDRGMPVSCSGSYIEDSIDGFYRVRHETAVLTKHGFGTSGYFGEVRPRGSKIRGGGEANGVVPVVRSYVQDSRDVSQGGVRRGAWAAYLPIDHGDFFELADYVKTEQDDVNVGWNISSGFVSRLDNGDVDALARYQRSLKIKCELGKGYYFFPDKVNARRPKMYKDNGLFVNASNLCTEITLFSDKDYTFTCVLASMNLAKYDEWKDTDAIFVATVFLDCVASEFIARGKGVRGLEKSIAFTQAGRALGLGVCGFHSYLQRNRISFESFAAHNLNSLIFKELHDKSLEASRWMAQSLGEPAWCKGYGVRNTHRTAIAPTMSTALIMGGVSQGIEPVIANVFTQGSAGGELKRVNPELLSIMKDRGVYNDKTLTEINNDNGSVRNVTWLDEEEKTVFKTAYEIDQRAILRLAATRQQWICQAQSINLFFDADEDEGYIAEIHKEAFHNPNILSLYYLRSLPGVHASKDECEACQ